MSVTIVVNNSDKDVYLTWTPVTCKLKTDKVKREVVIRNKTTNTHGRVVFLLDLKGHPVEELKMKLKGDGKAVSFYMAGYFDHFTGKGYASQDDKDTMVEVVELPSGRVLDTIALMVRVRKNANKLTPAERDRFLSAMVRLNKSGKYIDYQNMHLESTGTEIHGRSSFLVWHRAFILDLERRLQAIDPAVTLPYWKFDEAAPNVFNQDFMGVPDATGMVDFSATNPLINWKVQLFGVGSGSRVRRLNDSDPTSPGVWDPATQGAVEVQRNEEQTLDLGLTFNEFKLMEGDPHGMAHVSFDGQISDIGKAPADPLFFLLHCNVDRLWAKWQWVLDEDGYRFDPGLVKSYPNQGLGNTTSGGETGVGNYTRDTMWPWNGVSTRPRPNIAPGGPFPDSGMVKKPGRYPKVSDMVDYQGQIKISADLNYAYDDVPYDFES